MHKDPLLKDKIIKWYKHFRHRHQFTPNNRNKTSKWKPRMPKDKLNSILNYKIYQALVDMLHKDHEEPNDPSEASQIHAISTTADENNKTEFVINQLLDPKYQYDLSPLAKQTESSIINSSVHKQIHVIKHNLSALVQVDDGAQTTTCHEKQLLHNYQPYSYSCRKPSILGRDKINHHSEGYGYIYTVTSDNELIKIKLEFIPMFPITVISSGRFKEQLGKQYKSYMLYYNSTKHRSQATFYHIQTKHRDVILLTVYKKRLSYIPIIKSNDTYQVHLMLQLMKDTLWHQRLGHRHQIKYTAKHVKGMPKDINNLQPRVYLCSVCK